MKEVKSPKKPLIYYYGIVLLVIFLFNIIFNMFILPSMYQQQVVEVDYGKFMDMIDAKDIGMVQVEDTQIPVSYTHLMRRVSWITRPT